MFVFALIAVMVVFGAWTARGRARSVPGLVHAAADRARRIAARHDARAGRRARASSSRSRAILVPVGGMVVGNAMTAAAVSLNRLGDEVRTRPARIEATLALGATVRQAMLPTVRRSLRSGMIPLIDSTKTTGVIFFPGTMVGMLLAGADPVDAVRLQLILLWTLLGSVSLSALTATGLAYRNFFTPAQQLKDL